jgi:hypothetical protein
MFFRNLCRRVLAVFFFALIATASFGQVPLSHHVVLVIDENSGFNYVMAHMPWLVAQGNANGYATNYHSDNGGSLLDYLWLASGSCHSAVNCVLPAGTHDFNCNGNSCYYPGTTTTDAITDDNIFREMNRAGISWKVYAQSYAAAGGKVTTRDRSNNTSYYRRHNGAVWYSDILNNVSGSANRVVDLSQLNVDLANDALPRFMIIVPDGNHDAHDCPVGMSTCTGVDKLTAADQFLSSALTPILSTRYFQPAGDGLLFVTFDECGAGTNAGCGASVYIAVIGPNVIPQTVSTLPYRHENTLRTILEALGITRYPGAAASAAPMSDFFPSSLSQPIVSVASPTQASVGSALTLQASATATAGHSISGWHVYVDGIAAYKTGAADTINPTLNLTGGQHILVVRAWDTSGAFGDQRLSLKVNVARPTVALSTPRDGVSIGSPVNIQAAASPTAGHRISGWRIYVDGNRVYRSSWTSTINASIPMNFGTHKVVIRAWDTSGAFGDQRVKLDVTDRPAVTVSFPAPGLNVNSPIHLSASATPSSGHSISAWHIYLDGVAVYKTGAMNAIRANITSTPGQHDLLVRTWDSSGAFGDQRFSLQVEPVAVNIASPLDRASLNSPVNIQATASSAHRITGWRIYADSKKMFSQSGGTSINADFKLVSGAHRIVVRAWDNTGMSGSDVTNIVVP